MVLHSLLLHQLYNVKIFKYCSVTRKSNKTISMMYVSLNKNMEILKDIMSYSLSDKFITSNIIKE